MLRLGWTSEDVTRLERVTYVYKQCTWDSNNIQSRPQHTLNLSKWTFDHNTSIALIYNIAKTTLCACVCVRLLEWERVCASLSNIHAHKQIHPSPYPQANIHTHLHVHMHTHTFLLHSMVEIINISIFTASSAWWWEYGFDDLLWEILHFFPEEF